jgi:hypothetical protein
VVVRALAFRSAPHSRLVVCNFLWRPPTRPRPLLTCFPRPSRGQDCSTRLRASSAFTHDAFSRWVRCLRSEAARTTPRASQTVARGAHASRSKVLATPHPWKTRTQELHTEGVPDSPWLPVFALPRVRSGTPCGVRINGWTVSGVPVCEHVRSAYMSTPGCGLGRLRRRSRHVPVPPAHQKPWEQARKSCVSYWVKRITTAARWRCGPISLGVTREGASDRLAPGSAGGTSGIRIAAAQAVATSGSSSALLSRLEVCNFPVATASAAAPFTHLFPPAEPGARLSDAPARVAA